MNAADRLSELEREIDELEFYIHFTSGIKHIMLALHHRDLCMEYNQLEEQCP